MRKTSTKERFAKELVIAIIVSIAIQTPFAFLMTHFGLHSSLGAVYYIFYMPASWLADAIRLPSTELVLFVLQEIVLIAIILLLTAIYKRIRQVKKVIVD